MKSTADAKTTIIALTATGFVVFASALVMREEVVKTIPNPDYACSVEVVKKRKAYEDFQKIPTFAETERLLKDGKSRHQRDVEMECQTAYRLANNLSLVSSFGEVAQAERFAAECQKARARYARFSNSLNNTRRWYQTKRNNGLIALEDAREEISLCESDNHGDNVPPRTTLSYPEWMPASLAEFGKG